LRSGSVLVLYESSETLRECLTHAERKYNYGSNNEEYYFSQCQKPKAILTVLNISNIVSASLEATAPIPTPIANHVFLGNLHKPTTPFHNLVTYNAFCVEMW
jgi:hypothetical protein